MFLCLGVRDKVQRCGAYHGSNTTLLEIQNVMVCALGWKKEIKSAPDSRMYILYNLNVLKYKNIQYKMYYWIKNECN